MSIVIPVHNKSLYTFNCLASIEANTERPSYEAILVDDASTDDTQYMLEQVQNVRVVRNPENLGFVDSCNKGAALASGKYLLLLNNDTKVHKGWLRALVEAIEQDDSAGLVGAKLLFADGRLQEAGGIIFGDGSGWNYGRFEDPEDPTALDHGIWRWETLRGTGTERGGQAADLPQPRPTHGVHCYPHPQQVAIYV